MAVKKSIAIIGEGETEWWYFETLRVACRYKFKVAPDFPQHSDIFVWWIWIVCSGCLQKWQLIRS